MDGYARWGMVGGSYFNKLSLAKGGITGNSLGVSEIVGEAGRHVGISVIRISGRGYRKCVYWVVVANWAASWTETTKDKIVCLY